LWGPRPSSTPRREVCFVPRRPRRRGQRPTRSLPKANLGVDRLLAFLSSSRAMRPSNELLRKNDAALASLLKNKIGTRDILECLPIVGQRLEQLLPDVEDRLLKNTLGRPDLLECLPIVDLARGLLIVLILNKLPRLQSTPYLRRLRADLCSE